MVHELSTTKSFVSGVQQGSVLGSLLFIIIVYTDDMANQITSLSFDYIYLYLR